MNYCEAVRLATPPVIKESIQITLNALHEYRTARTLGKVPNMKYDRDVNARFDALYAEAKGAIELLETNIPSLYTPEGFYKVFTEGFLPVPYLMDQQKKFKKATQWHTAIKNGGIKVVDDEGNDYTENYIITGTTNYVSIKELGAIKLSSKSLEKYFC